ncbi:MAG: hypothetical protein ACRD07_02455 [Acidimicrobiales bacterium]
MEFGFFDEVAEAVRGLVAGDRVDLRQQARRWGLKAWFGTERPAREHYEAQLIAPDGVDGATASALEIGFHAEHRDAADNEATIAHLVAGQERWRAALGDDAVVGPFLGRFPDWRRVSEAWPDPDLDDPELPVQVALRLTDYIGALEPLRRSH